MRKEGQKAPRKVYAKPRIAIEDFTLNQFIASCKINVNKHQNDWLTELAKVDKLAYAAAVRTNQFADSLGCTVHADTITGSDDTLCYHTSTSPLFTS